jgi:hypothetical protein
MLAVGICALDAGDALGVVAAANELFHHLDDTHDSESAIDDRVFVFILISQALKMLLEQKLKGTDSARLVRPLRERGRRKG